jgi:hypothetical protein
MPWKVFTMIVSLKLFPTQQYLLSGVVLLYDSSHVEVTGVLFSPLPYQECAQSYVWLQTYEVPLFLEKCLIIKNLLSSKRMTETYPKHRDNDQLLSRVNKKSTQPHRRSTFQYSQLPPTLL